MNLSNKFYLTLVILLLLSFILGSCSNKDKETVNQQVQDLQSELGKLKSENDGYKLEIDTLTNEIENSNKKYNELYSGFSKNILEKLELENEMQNLNDEILRLEGNIIGLKNELNIKIEQLWQYEKLLQRNKKELQGIIKPGYILNIYNPVFITEGDKIAGLIVEEKHISVKDELNIPIYEDIKFRGEYKVRGNIYFDKHSNLIKLKISQEQLINIPIPYNNFNIEFFEVTVLNGEELIYSLGNKYFDNIEVIATYSGFRHYGKIEAEKMTEITFVELISINN